MKSFYTYCKEDNNKLLLRYVDEYGKRRNEIISNYSPVLYTECDTESKFKSHNGKNLKARKFSTIKDAKHWTKENKDLIKIYGYDKYDRTYLSHRWNYSTITDSYDEDKIIIAFLDIETEVGNEFADPERCDQIVNAISFKTNLDNKTYTFGLKPLNLNIEKVEYFYCDGEESLFNTFLQVWNKILPDVLSGWNSDSFDVPYLINRMFKIIPKHVHKLSPFNSIYKNHDGYWTIKGISQLDYMKIYKKTKTKSSYKLDNVALDELNDEKLKHFSNIPGHKLYKNYYEDFIRYNIHDVELIYKLEDKLKLISGIYSQAYASMVNFDDCFLVTRTIDSLIYNELKEENIFFETFPRKKENEEYTGAYVKTPIPGKYNWVCSFDLTSQYPSLIRAQNISPEMLVEKSPIGEYVDDIIHDGDFDVNALALKNNYTFCANGQMFRKDKIGFLPKLVKRLFKLRYDAKQKMLEYQKLRNTYDKDSEDYKKYDILYTRYGILQNNRKVQLNSIYGALGNHHFRFYDIRMAEAITLSAQTTIRFIGNEISAYMNKLLKTENVDYVIYIDTDSLYINFGDFVNKFLKGHTTDEICKILSKFSENEVQNVIQIGFNKLANIFNSYEPEAFKMDREAISDASLFLMKKRYILHILDMEGVKPVKGNELKIMGVEAKKSSTPKLCRDAMEKAFDIFLYGDEESMKRYIKNFKNEFNKNIFDMGRITSVGSVDKYYDSNGDIKYVNGKKPTIPQQSRAANVYNQFIKNNNLESDYELIHGGDKVKIIELTMPNMLNSNVIAWIDSPPSEMELHKCINYDTQFHKIFFKPINDIAIKIGWNINNNAAGCFF